MSCSFAFKKKRLSIFSLLASIPLHNGKPTIPQHGHAQLITKLINIGIILDFLQKAAST